MPNQNKFEALSGGPEALLDHRVKQYTYGVSLIDAAVNAMRHPDAQTPDHIVAVADGSFNPSYPQPTEEFYDQEAA